MKRQFDWRLCLGVVGLLVMVVGLAAMQNQNFGGVGLPAGLLFSSPTFTISSAGNGNGVLALAGNTSGTATLTAPGTAGTATNPVAASNSLQVPNSAGYTWNSDSGIGRSAAGIVSADTSTPGNGLGTLIATAYQTKTNCASTGGTCGSAASGSVGITNPATTVTVATTAVTANSVILVTEDATLGTKLTATCNSTTGRTYLITTRTPATSFIITASATPAANTACLNYWIIN